jgi:tyrosine-protein kinase Etk/Wzc
MSDNKGFHLLDYLEFLAKRKHLLVLVFGLSLVLTYGSVYFFVREQFDATATIIPRQEESTSLASGLLRGVKGLPLGLGTSSLNSDVDLYKTIIFSRTMLEDVVRKFELVKTYGLDTSDPSYMEKAIKILFGQIQTKETEESAFVVTVRGNTRQRAADMTNYIVRAMNERIVDLQVSRSRENRIFLENRVADLKAQLKASEDTLRSFQERTGLLDVKTQVAGILTADATLETELTAKRFQLGILERLYNKDASQVKDMQLQIQAYEQSLAKLRSHGDPGSPLLPLKGLPQTSVEFLRRYRDVEINSLLIEYVMPLYEQARIEEKKDYPVLQVIDYAIPPAKKSYPPRVLFAVIGACSVTILVLFLLMLREAILKVQDPRLLALMNDVRHWDWRSRKK